LQEALIGIGVMNDMTLRLAAQRVSDRRRSAGPLVAALRPAATYLVFALSLAFAFAVVIGVI